MKSNTSQIDVAVIGGGIAGVMAAIYATRQALTTLLFEPGPIGGTAFEAADVENWPGSVRIKGSELAAKLDEQLQANPDVKLLSQRVSKIESDDNGFTLTADEGAYRASAVILATGSKHRRLEAPGEQEFAGKGVSYCTTCDAPFYKNKTVGMVGGGDSAIQGAIYLTDLGATVHLIHRRAEFRAEPIGIAAAKKLAEQGKLVFHTPAVVKSVEGTKKLERVVLENPETGARETLPLDGLFVKIGQDPQVELAEQVGAQLNAKRNVVVDLWRRTNIPGFYAAGDVTGIGEQFVVSASDGCLAALDAYEYLKKKGKK